MFSSVQGGTSQLHRYKVQNANTQAKQSESSNEIGQWFCTMCNANLTLQAGHIDHHPALLRHICTAQDTFPGPGHVEDR